MKNAWHSVRKKAELKKELDKRKKEIREKLDDEYYASKDDVYAEMLKRYKSLQLKSKFQQEI